MEQIPGILLHHDVDRIEQTLKVALLDERCAQIRHNEITDEHNALIRQVDQHCVVSFSSLHGNELDACSADLQLGATIDREVGLEAEYVIDAEAFAEEWLVENARSSGAASDLFSVVVRRIELQSGVQGTKILVPANVIPVGMRDENGRQFRQVSSIRSQCLVGSLSRVGACACIDSDQFLPIVRHHEIVFRELETGQG